MYEPKYLYHYTSIENLALILKNKTIRFSSLSTVDDLREAKTEDFGEIGRFCFVSCWTDMKEESIPLWKMYTPNMTGVRIKLPIRPFEKYKISKGSHYNEKEFYSYIDPNIHFSKDGSGYLFSPVEGEDFIYKVGYTKEESLIFPKIYECSDNSKSIKIKNIGKYKDDVWKFQEEWRYKLFFWPITMEEFKNIKSREEQNGLLSKVKEKDLPFQYYDLKIDGEKFQEMEILVGPRANDAQKIIIESLINKYNKGINVEDSILSLR
ncbi:DUF2971 domain-containing protein [Clostridium chromiireducens]|uniref:DUF2971 domain-containing protein n=1 Tax=Clostridium chromiireducens TaxID=225345 RepID=A0A964W513_9CLOT|nr:DUF2971 domain-containing protein [Clostridium chromiireducens]MVX66954.1 DUF2971 domain-containing protein [Clostridium chromiireducens]